MSGGSFDYLYLKIEDAVSQIYYETSKEEVEFSELLKEIAKLLKSIEWAHSGDTSLENFKKDWNKFKEEKLK